MRKKLGTYLNSLFAGAPRTAKVNELEQELLADLYEKYDDLIAQGRSEQDAYNIAIGGIGDVNELLKNLENDKIYNYAKREQESKLSAIRVSTAVALYILSVASVILFGIIGDETGNSFLEEIGVVVMFAIAAVATAILVYNGMSRSKYRKSDDSIVENYKEQVKKSDNNNAVYNSIIATLWPIAVIVFLILGLFFGLFSVAWVVFIATAGIQNIIKLLFLLNNKKIEKKQIIKVSNSILWTFVTVAYFIISFATEMWAVTWIVFIIGVAVQALMRVIFELRDVK